MKKIMLALMAMSAIDNVASQGQTITGLLTPNLNQASTELITNGNFQTTHCHPETCISHANDFVRGWTPQPDIEVGFGSYYNRYLGKERVLDLATNSNSCVRQVVKGLKAGTYRLKFEYAARTDAKGQDCKFAVKFNGKVLKSITPLDDRIRTEVIDIPVAATTDGVIQFCSTGEENDRIGAILKSVSLAAKTGKQVDPDPVLVPIKRPGDNFIVNPDFEKNPCTDHWCYYNSHRPNVVEGWIPDTDLEVGYGSIYNQFLDEKRVLDLAPASNQCVRQVVRDLRPGLYDLTYEYAARTTHSVIESEFEVSFEGKVLRKISPVSDRVEKDTVVVEVKEGNDGILKFCSLGPNNHEGGLLKSVFMTRKKISEQPPGIKQFAILLDSHSGKCLQRQFKFGMGKIDINFEYNLLSNAVIRDSVVYVTLDNVPIYQISPCSNGKKISFQLDVKAGTYRLGFCVNAASSELRHQVKIQNLQLDQKAICVEGWGQDLIRNGGFQDNKCDRNRDWCHYNRHNIGNSVPGWIASPDIEIGKINIYNTIAWNKAPSVYAAELDVAKNSCIKQRIPEMKEGKYQLKFDWTSKTGTGLDSNGLEVKISGQTLESFDATDFDLQRETVEFVLDKAPSDALLEFCGTGKSDHFGASIDNIQLIRYNTC